MKVLNLVLAIVVSLLMAFGVLEGGLRVIGKGPPKTLNAFDPDLGWGPEPGLRLTRSHPDGGSPCGGASAGTIRQRPALAGWQAATTAEPSEAPPNPLPQAQLVEPPQARQGLTVNLGPVEGRHTGTKQDSATGPRRPDPPEHARRSPPKPRRTQNQSHPCSIASPTAPRRS